MPRERSASAAIQDRATTQPWVTTTLLTAVACGGIGVRASALLAERSLWLDEVSLALNIRERGFLELLGEPLEFGQSAPPGFLLLSRLAMATLGDGLVAVRAIPFLAGCLTLIVGIAVAKRAFTTLPAQALFLLGISASPTLVYYSTEMKPYAVDALAVILALYLASRLRDERIVYLASIIGFSAVVLSLPGLFVFGALALLTAGRSFASGGIAGLIAEVRSRWLMYAAWGVGAATHLSYAVTSGADRSVMQAWWRGRGGFAPPVSEGLSGLSWYGERFVELLWLMFENTQVPDPGAKQLSPFVVLAAVALLALVVVRRRRPSAVVLFAAGIMGLALLLAALSLYPLSSRLAIYLIPVMMLLFSAGLDSSLWSRSVGRGIVAFAAAGIIVNTQLAAALGQLQSPYLGRDMVAVLNVLNREVAPGDVVVTNDAGSRIFRWHRDGSSFDGPLVTLAAEDAQAAVEERLLADGRPERVWVASTHRLSGMEEIADALFSQYPYRGVFFRDETFIALASMRGPIAFVETDDRQLFTVLTAEIPRP